MMTNHKPPHILFLLDNLHLHKSGFYGLVRWTIRMLRRCPSTKHVRITCTSGVNSKQTTCDDVYSEFISKYDVYTLHPSRLGYALRDNENALTLDDLNKYDKQFYRSLKDNNGRELDDVSHIIAMAPLTMECCLNGGIVDRVKNEYNIKPKIIMLNHMTADPDCISSDVISELKGKLDAVISVGNRIYDRSIGSNLLLTETDASSNQPQCSIKSLLLYPTFDDISTATYNDESASHHVRVVTMYSRYIHESKTFLKDAANDIGASLSHLNSEWVVHWYIQWSYETPDKPKKEHYERKLQLYTGCLRDRLKIEIISDISKIISVCNLCIQPGFIDSDGYSGLETLLAGIPTLVLPSSDVHHIILRVNKDAEYFTYDHQSPTIRDKIKARILDNKDAFLKTSEFQYKYCKFKGTPHHASTIEGIRQYLNLFTGKVVSVNIILGGFASM